MWVIRYRTVPYTETWLQAPMRYAPDAHGAAVETADAIQQVLRQIGYSGAEAKAEEVQDAPDLEEIQRLIAAGDIVGAQRLILNIVRETAQGAPVPATIRIGDNSWGGIFPPVEIAVGGYVNANANGASSLPSRLICRSCGGENGHRMGCPSLTVGGFR